jgi:AcrR family transcriptional regulator
VDHWTRVGKGRVAPERDGDRVGGEEYERVGAWTLYTLLKSYEATNDHADLYMPIHWACKQKNDGVPIGRMVASAMTRAPRRGLHDRSLSRTERAAQQRRRLMRAATKIFAHVGFGETTVDAIVREAGTSRRTFYEHFDDLRDLLLQLHEQSGTRAFRAVEQHVLAQHHPNDQLRAGVEAFLMLISQFGDEARVLFREVSALGPEHQVRREALLGRFATLMFQGVARSHAMGIAKRPPDELRIYAIVAAVEAIGMRYVERRDEARALEAVEPLVDLIRRAFE